MVLLKLVKSSSPKKFDPSETLLSVAEFLHSYNETIPTNFLKASLPLLQKYKEEHASFFKHAEMWSLAEHRKKIMDWLPLNNKMS